MGWVIDDATPVIYRTAERLEGLLALRERLRLYWDDYVVEYALGNQMALVGAALSGKDTVTETWTKIRSGLQVSWEVRVVPLGVLAVLFLFWLRNRKRKGGLRVVYWLDEIFSRLLPHHQLGTLTYEEASALVVWSQWPNGKNHENEINALCRRYREARFAGLKVSQEHWSELEKSA